MRDRIQGVTMNNRLSGCRNRITSIIILVFALVTSQAGADSSIDFKGSFAENPLIDAKAENKIELNIVGENLDGLAVVTLMMPAGEYCDQGGIQRKFDQAVEARTSFSFSGKMGPGGVGSFSPQGPNVAEVKSESVGGKKQHYFRVDPVLEVHRQGVEVEGTLTIKWPSCSGGLWKYQGTEEERPSEKKHQWSHIQSVKNRITPGMMGFSVKFKTDQAYAQKVHGPDHQTVFSWKPVAPPKEGRMGQKFLISARLAGKGGEKSGPKDRPLSIGQIYWKCKEIPSYPEGKLPRLRLEAPHAIGSFAKEGEVAMTFPWNTNDCQGQPEFHVTTYTCANEIKLKYKYAWEEAKIIGQPIQLHFGGAPKRQTDISVCPRIGPGDSDRLTAAVFAHPGFPARITVMLEEGHRASYSLPSDSMGQLTFNGVEWAKKLETWAYTARNPHGPTRENVYYHYKADPAIPLTSPLIEEVLVEIKDSSGKVVDSQKVKIVVGVGLDLDRIALFEGLPLSAGQGYVIHALKTLVKSRLQPNLDLGWFEKECNSCRDPEGQPKDGLMPGGMKVDFRGIWLNQEGRSGPRNEIDVFSGGTQIETVKSSGIHFLSPMSYVNTEGQHRKMYIGAIFAQPTTDGQSHTIYPAVKQVKEGHFVVMVRTRPRLNGKLIQLPESQLDGTRYFVVTRQQPETMYQSLACVLKPTTVSQVVIIETLKLLPAQGTTVSWGLNLTDALCSFSHRRYEEGFMGIFQEGAEEVIERVVFDKLTPASLRKYYPDLKGEDLETAVNQINTVYKVAKSKYKILVKSGKLKPRGANLQ